MKGSIDGHRWLFGEEEDRIFEQAVAYWASDRLEAGLSAELPDGGDYCGFVWHEPERNMATITIGSHDEGVIARYRWDGREIRPVDGSTVS